MFASRFSFLKILKPPPGTKQPGNCCSALGKKDPSPPPTCHYFCSTRLWWALIMQVLGTILTGWGLIPSIPPLMWMLHIIWILSRGTAMHSCIICSFVTTKTILWIYNLHLFMLQKALYNLFTTCSFQKPVLGTMGLYNLAVGQVLVSFAPFHTQ